MRFLGQGDDLSRALASTGLGRTPQTFTRVNPAFFNRRTTAS
jgi:hypothetical protein